jgi:citrate synthase
LLAVCDFVDEVEQATGLHVRHELPMVALTRAMGLTRQAASAIFLVSRTAGWVAHIQEQRESGQLMRPRAHFVGAGSTGASLKNQS